jgi:hypothetical protein
MNFGRTRKPGVNRRQYQIVVEGRIDPGWSDWFQGMGIASQIDPDGSCRTVLSGAVVDQAGLRGILNKIWDLNLVLVSVQQDSSPTILQNL